jgi:hypothetical protein
MPTPSVDIPQPCGEGNKLKTEAMELLGKLAPTIKPCLNRLFTKNK